MKTLTTYMSLGLAAGAYATLLNTPEGREYAKEHTAESVVFGTSIVLTFLRFLLPASIWRKVVLAFAVAGTPMVVRSFMNRAERGEFGD